MKLSRIILYLALFFILAVMYLPKQTYATTSLNLLTFNMVHSHAETSSCLMDIAQFIKDKQIDIVALQENEQARKSEDRNTTMDWYDYILDRLDEIGYPMQGYFGSEGNIDPWRRRGNSLYIKSGLEVVSYDDMVVSEVPPTTYLQWAKIRIPEGDFYTVNMHPNPAASCPQHNSYFTILDPLIGDRPRIVMGDFNRSLAENTGYYGLDCIQNYVTNYINGCDRNTHPDCEDSINHHQWCKGRSDYATCIQSSDFIIDNIVYQKWSSGWYWNVTHAETFNEEVPFTGCIDGDAYATNFSDHFAVFSQVQISNSPFVTPTPTPSNTPTPTKTPTPTPWEWCPGNLCPDHKPFYCYTSSQSNCSNTLQSGYTCSNQCLPGDRNNNASLSTTEWNNLLSNFYTNYADKNRDGVLNSLEFAEIATRLN